MLIGNLTRNFTLGGVGDFSRRAGYQEWSPGVKLFVAIVVGTGCLIKAYYEVKKTAVKNLHAECLQIENEFVLIDKGDETQLSQKIRELDALLKGPWYELLCASIPKSKVVQAK